MYMYVCMYIYIYIYVHVCMCVCVCVGNSCVVIIEVDSNNYSNDRMLLTNVNQITRNYLVNHTFAHSFAQSRIIFRSLLPFPSLLVFSCVNLS